MSFGLRRQGLCWPEPQPSREWSQLVTVTALGMSLRWPVKCLFDLKCLSCLLQVCLLSNRFRSGRFGYCEFARVQVYRWRRCLQTVGSRVRFLTCQLLARSLKFDWVRSGSAKVSWLSCYFWQPKHCLALQPIVRVAFTVVASWVHLSHLWHLGWLNDCHYYSEGLVATQVSWTSDCSEHWPSVAIFIATSGSVATA